MLVVVVLGAVQMFVLGLMGEYIGRLYNEAKQRPLYIVQEIAGGAAHAARTARLMSPRRPRTATIPAARAPGRSGERSSREGPFETVVHRRRRQLTRPLSLPAQPRGQALRDREREQQAVEIADRLELERRVLDQPRSARFE